MSNLGTSAMFVGPITTPPGAPIITIQPKIDPEGPVKWKGEVEVYFLNNVIFNKYLWMALVEKKIVSLKGILRLGNIEQRMAAIRFMGIEWLLKESKAELIDKSERGNELYRIDKIFRQPAYFLKYKDISTDRVYFSGVDPEALKNEEKKNRNGELADKAMGWKFSWSLKEYNKLKIES